MDDPDFAAFSREVRERVRADMQSIRNPDGDVHPALYHHFAGESIRRIKLPKSAFDRERRHALADAIATATRVSRPRLLAFETTAYYQNIDHEGLSPEDRAALQRREYVPSRPRPSEDPEATEVVQLLIFDRTQAEAWYSVIERDGRNPPTFGEWGSIIEGATPAEVAEGMTGRMLEPIRTAMWGR